jgi:two-component system, chemotaxis family, response regulator Rcp1
VTRDALDILLVEDNPGDVRLTREALREAGLACKLHVVHDGVEALAYLRCEPPFASASRPDLMLLDLNLPRKDGREVLAELKLDRRISSIPVVVLTTSRAHDDIQRAYELYASSYIVKPVNIETFFDRVRKLVEFWLSAAVVPRNETPR